VNNLSEGWTALSGGSEQEAWAIFEQELEAGGSAEALEGLSWAAWWLDGADTLWPSAAISATRSPEGAAVVPVLALVGQPNTTLVD
jgi:hypothetical protein